MESFVGLALAIAVFAAGFGLGVLFRVQRGAPVPKESGLGSAVILLKQVSDKALAESAATREFSTGIVTRLLESNDKLADKCLVIVDGTLDRMRIETDGTAPPRVDPPAWPSREPELVIEDKRGGSPLD